MKKQKFADVVLVFDSYYRDKPNAVALILKRILLCCGINLCALMYIFQIYQLSVNRLLSGIICVLASILFSVLFVFVKKLIAIPSIILIVGLAIWRIGEPFFERLSLFWDKILLIMDGRFFYSSFFISNVVTQINSQSPAYQRSELLGVILLISIFSFITAACLFNKIHSLPMILVWIILWIPALVGEKLYFNWWLIPSVALYIAVIAMSISYSQGLAIGKGVTSYHGVVRYNEISFLRHTAKQPYTSKVVNRHEYYSKYYSLGTYLFIVFAILGIVSTILLNGKDGLDYSTFYDFVNSIGPTSQRSSPFESGALSEYFINPGYNMNFRDATLGISSPGQGNQEILSVTNSGELPVYLRGDIGIDFTGGSWTSPVNTDLSKGLWEQTELSDAFRPAELNALLAYIDDRNSGDLIIHPDSDLIRQQDVTVNYLCDTNVAFLPSYATDFGYYGNEMFDIYGDFVARANKKYNTVSTLNFTALVPNYINVDSLSGELGSDTVGVVNYLIGTDFYEINDYFDKFCSSANVFSRYRDYVNRAYLDVPDELAEPLDVFISANNLGLHGGVLDVPEVYQTAVRVADFLRDNYTYSLIAPIDPNNPIMSFLNDVKSGHCALYASSMTLILREMGIPARYCTGFVAQPGNGEPQVLRARNLHAWCEVYLGRLGWVTFDPTSAAAMGNFGTSDISIPDFSGDFSVPQISISISSDSAQSSEVSSDSSSKTDESDNKSNDSEESDSTIVPFGNNKVNPLQYILGISGIVIVAGLIALVIYRYKVLEDDAKKALKRYYKSNDSDLLLAKIHDVMWVCGFRPNRGELPEDFYMRADKSLGCEIYSNHEVLEAAAFGKSGRSDCRALAKLLENLYNQAEKDSKFTRKIRLRKSLVKNK
ncbi:MAG: transglutaminase domain-containing protein [Ruminococcaceae bacterium]|nr:transglutaminase domain-containing protein [Oscillospiraceae bacterium]